MQILHTLASWAGKAMRPLRAGEEKLASRTFGVAGGALRVMSPAFVDGAVMPDHYASAGGASPPLEIGGVPKDAKEIVLICEDPDAPLRHPFVHWMLRVPARVTSLAQGIVTTPKPPNAPLGTVQGKSTLHRHGYTGPTPPPGHGPHHYHFQVFALDSPLMLPPDAPRDEVVSAMRGRVIAKGEVVGVYEQR